MACPFGPILLRRLSDKSLKGRSFPSEKEAEMPDPASNSYQDLNVLSPDPLCAALFLPDMYLPVSATEGHFIRSHFAAPEIGASGWSLPVTGEVETPLNLSYDDILKMPSHEVTSLMECAGNSRSTMQPPAEGVQ